MPRQHPRPRAPQTRALEPYVPAPLTKQSPSHSSARSQPGDAGPGQLKVLLLLPEAADFYSHPLRSRVGSRFATAVCPGTRRLGAREARSPSPGQGGHSMVLSHGSYPGGRSAAPGASPRLPGASVGLLQPLLAAVKAGPRNTRPTSRLRTDRSPACEQSHFGCPREAAWQKARRPGTSQPAAPLPPLLGFTGAQQVAVSPLLNLIWPAAWSLLPPS